MRGLRLADTDREFLEYEGFGGFNIPVERRTECEDAIRLGFSQGGFTFSCTLHYGDSTRERDVDSRDRNTFKFCIPQ